MSAADALAFVLAFLLGRLGSVLLYQGAWSNGKDRRFNRGGALLTFLGRPWPWLAHVPVLALGAGLDWQGMPRLQVFTLVAAGALALAAVGRWGAVDIGRFFVFDRCLVGILWLGLWMSPAFLYPLLLACCCLHYTVSGWPLNPGYSNLLGYEFMRSSLCMVLAALLVQACLRLSGAEAARTSGSEDMALAVVLCGQAAGYVQQALAKCALGRRWYSWILENRLQCLVVNACLRGWSPPWMRLPRVLRLARWMSRARVPLCGAVWLVEISWLLILADPRPAFWILAATTAFHLAVWSFTGLSGYHYMISHVLMMIVFAASPSAPAGFNPELALIGGCCILSSSIGVLLLRRRLFREYSRSGAAGPWARLADPSDHLMAWWDGPYMRLYSYSVKTASGRRFHFPVTRFSPYDTFLTDIHTHLMILGRGWELDPRLDADRAVVRAGVWGLTVSLADRDRLYRWMDSPLAGSSALQALLDPAPDPGVGGDGADRVDAVKVLDCSRSPESETPLAAFFHGLNRYQGRRWFRVLLLWPHFPGEDRVPDWSPLSAERLSPYEGAEPVTEVACHCIKTFYHGGSIHRVDERVFARLLIKTPDPEADSGGEAAGLRLRARPARSR